MTTAKWDYLGGRSPAPLRPGLTIEETNRTVTDIQEGEFLFQQVARRHSSRWNAAAPLGSLTPRRTPISKDPETLTLRGAIYLPRLAAARAHAAKLAGLITRTVQVTLHIEGASPKWYTVDDFLIDWEYSGGLELGGEWSLTLTEIDSVTPADGGGGAPPPSIPMLTGVVDATVTRGEVFTLRLGATVSLSPSGFYIAVTGLPDGLRWSRNQSSIVGTPSAHASSGVVTVQLLDKDDAVVDTQTMRITVNAAPALSVAARFGPGILGVWRFQRGSRGSQTFTIPIIGPDNAALTALPTGWTLTTILDLPTGLTLDTSALTISGNPYNTAGVVDEQEWIITLALRQAGDVTETQEVRVTTVRSLSPAPQAASFSEPSYLVTYDMKLGQPLSQLEALNFAPTIVGPDRQELTALPAGWSMRMTGAPGNFRVTGNRVTGHLSIAITPKNYYDCELTLLHGTSVHSRARLTIAITNTPAVKFLSDRATVEYSVSAGRALNWPLGIQDVDGNSLTALPSDWSVRTRPLLLQRPNLALSDNMLAVTGTIVGRTAGQVFIISFDLYYGEIFSSAMQLTFRLT